jgi:uncharacterized membrane protein
MISAAKHLPKYIFVVLAILIAAYALSYYWHSDTPFSVRYQHLNPVGVYSHFIGAGFALLLGGLQVFIKVGSRNHRLLGYGYCLAVTIGCVGGCYLALNAYLGLVTGLGFFIADALWISTTFMAVQRARSGRIRAHRQWIWRSMALTSAGISLRILLPLLSIFFSFNTSYIMVAWFSWIGNLIFVEIYLHHSSLRRIKKNQLLPSIERNLAA